MPTFHSDQLFQMATRILQAAGVPVDDADVVAGQLRDANLVGHDSHGLIRLMQYVEYIQRGYIRPGSGFEVLKDETGFAIVDGRFDFGQVTATRALEVGLEKAETQGTATVVIRNCNHVGRLGSYVHKAALRGCASMMCVNAPGPGGVAPFGGIQRRLGTNPIAISAPRGDEPLVLDMTSSATAEGKLRVAYQKGEPVPQGWIIDAAGNPTTNPADFYADPPGSLLPLGGPLGFKGFGLAVMIDVFGGILSGSGVCRDDVPPGVNGVWMYCLKVSSFLAQEEYDRLIEKYAAHITSSLTMPGCEEILLPGQIEQRRRDQRCTEGVRIADETWRQISQLADQLGVSLEETGAT